MSNESSKRWAKTHPHENAAKTFRQRRGITYSQRDAILAAQGGVCKICGTTKPGSRRGWHADHMKDTKFIRGILCHRCNLGQGWFTHDPKLLRRVARYLETAARQYARSSLGDVK